MRILLDESTPLLVKTSLRGFDISTVQEMGWAGLKNGELLKLAEKQFDVFVTADRKLRHQQDLSALRLAVIVLPSNRVTVVKQLLPEIAEVLKSVLPGTVVELRLAP